MQFVRGWLRPFVGGKGRPRLRSRIAIARHPFRLCASGGGTRCWREF
jgi:hypothetical protein